MSSLGGRRAGSANRLLRALPRAEYERLLPSLESVTLDRKDMLYDANAPIEHAYFIEEGVGSILALAQPDALIEVATIGNEGMVGIPLFLGADRNGTRALMQIPGTALRVSADPFRQAIKPGTALHGLLQRYTQVLMVQMSQGVACNRLHPVEARAARWLLQTRDRINSDEIPLIQEFLGQMLGVRRQGVSAVQSLLQRQGLIRYSRGSITILDRAGLESVSCPCYRIIKAEFESMFGDGEPG